MIKCLIIEDEEPAQEVLKTYIGDFPVLYLEDCVNNAIDAMDILRSKKIDLIFLDIHLPKLSGLNFLRTLPHPPKTIITSAYQQYALDGYELDVVDYLLKPFSFERFIKAVNKVQGSSISQSSESDQKQDFIIVKNGKAFNKVPMSQINYLMSDGDLVKIFTEEETHMEFQSLRSYEKILSSEFLRVHKSYIINVSKLKSIDGNRLILGDQVIPIGRQYKKELLSKLNID